MSVKAFLYGPILVALLLGCQPSEAPSGRKTAPVHWVELQQVSLESTSVERVRTGTLTAYREIKLYNREEGQVNHLPFFVGDSVQQGEVIAQLDDALLKAQLQRAQAQLQQSQQSLKRARTLADQRLISVEELAQRETDYLKAAADVALLNTRLSYTKLAAPISGVVSARLVEEGGFAERYSHLLTITDLSRLKVELSLSELLLPDMAQGDLVSVSLDALPGKHFEGRVDRVHPTLDPATHRGTLEVLLDPAPEQARPGQLARVRLTTHPVERLMVPFQALRIDRQGEYLFLYDAPSQKVQVRRVVSGVRHDDRVEIVEGLQVGETVVVRGFLGLSEGRQVVPVADESKP